MHILIVDDSEATRAIVIRAVKGAGFADASYQRGERAAPGDAVTVLHARMRRSEET